MNKSQRQLRVIPELSIEGIPFPWDKTFSLLQQSCPLQPLIPSVRFKPAIELRMSNVEADWQIVLHWVVRKKWNPRLKIPVPCKVALLYERWGELMFRALELCIQCHNASHPASQYYRNPSDWYLQLIIEARSHDLCAVIDNQSPGKKSFIEDRYIIVKEL